MYKYRSKNSYWEVFISSYRNLTSVCLRRTILPSKNFPPILTVNVRSLEPKVNKIHIIAQLSSAHVLSITQTWLTDAVPNKAVNIPILNILMRQNRLHCSKNRGGGVCAHVHPLIPAERLYNFELGHLTTSWLHLKPNHTLSVLLRVIYHFNSNLDSFLS